MIDFRSLSALALVALAGACMTNWTQGIDGENYFSTTGELALLRQIFLSILREICSIAGRGTSTRMGEASRALAEPLS
jgi:hypothetical protein